jgi:hypothetical protein
MQVLDSHALRLWAKQLIPANTNGYSWELAITSWFATK